MLQQLIEWDKELFLLLNNTHTSFWDNFMWIYTDKLTWIPLIVAVVIILYRKNWREATLVLLALVLTIVLCDQFASSVCKPFFARFRPARDPEFSQFVEIVNGYRGGRYGFISSHASNAVGAVTLLSLIFHNRFFTYTGIAWAIVNCYTRIYLGVHYPGDILAGALAGILIAWAMYKGYCFGRQWLFRSKKPLSPYRGNREILFPTGVIYCTVIVIAIYAGYVA